jgi:hypothetical protein
LRSLVCDRCGWSMANLMLERTRLAAQRRHPLFRYHGPIDPSVLPWCSDSACRCER